MIRSVGHVLPLVAAWVWASCDGSKLMWRGLEEECERKQGMTYVTSWRKCLTLCIVIRVVGNEEIMMIGYILPT